MKSIYDNCFVKVGTKLFPYKKFFYALPLLLLMINFNKLFYPFNSHFLDEVFELTGLGVALAGVALRIWASGTSRRRVIKKSPKQRFSYADKGVFSIVRNPYFLGDLLIVTGLSIPLFDFISFMLCIAVFLLFYMPILFAEETILLNLYGDSYRAYCTRVRLMLPSMKHWKTAKSRFRWFLALRKEGNILGIVGVAYFIIEQFRDQMIQGQLDTNPLWLALLIPFVGLFLILRFMDRSFDDYPEFPSALGQD